MLTTLTHITLFVIDQDKALTFYKDTLGFKVHTDALFGTMRWLTLHLPRQKDVELVLMLAQTDEEKVLVGKQAGSKPFFSVSTDDCQKEYQALTQKGVFFLEAPQKHPWGIGASFKDIYGTIIYMCQTT